MRILIPAAALAALLAAGAAHAQSASSQGVQQLPPMRHPTGVRPIDNGPRTPADNQAFMGGGVILQGAPGAPAPIPQATPPGQTPANAIPLGPPTR